MTDPVPSEARRRPGPPGVPGGPADPFPSEPWTWQLPSRELSLEVPRVMGILNVTPDSFSDGGDLPDAETAAARARRMVEEGADLLDVGGESTRPGAAPVDADEEIQRVVPVIRALGGVGVPISVDTRKAEVAAAALDAGAEIVNDVSGLAFDPALADLAASRGPALVLMHMRGTPETMDRQAEYRHVCEEVALELGEALSRAVEAGVVPERVVLDPGLGFAKTPEQSYALLAGVDRLLSAGRPILIGPSRKRFLGAVLGRPPRERMYGTVAACVAGYLGGARIFRVHDVRPVAEALAVAAAVVRAGRAEGEVPR